MSGTQPALDDSVIYDLKQHRYVHYGPVNKTVRITLRSKDVIHSFFVPNFRLKQDAVPGREIPVWFKAIKAGKYEAPCAELCGFGHSGMKGWVFVHEQAEYDAWATEHKVGPAVTAPANG